MGLHFEPSSTSLHTPKLCENFCHVNSCLSIFEYIHLKDPVQYADWLTYQNTGTYQFCVPITFALKVRFSTLAGLYLR